MLKKIKIEHGIYRQNSSWDSLVEVKNGKVLDIKGISGITQYEDEVTFNMRDKQILYLPAFSGMHYYAFMLIIDGDDSTVLEFRDKENKKIVQLADIGHNLQEIKVSEYSGYDVYEAHDMPTGTLKVHPKTVVAGERTTVKITYTVGKEGISTGGKVRILTPYSCWGKPCQYLTKRFAYSGNAELSFAQSQYPISNRGYVYEVTVVKGSLKPGEVFSILHTNLSERGLRAQNYVQNDVGFLAWEDITGKGIFTNLLLDDCGFLDVVSGTPYRIRLKSDQIIACNQSIQGNLIVLDRMYNYADEYNKVIKLSLLDCNDSVVDELCIKPNNSKANFVFRNVMEKEGQYTLTAESEGLKVERLPLLVQEKAANKLYWGQLHAHSEVSDGTFGMDHFYDYGKNIGLLDFASLTDHDWEIVEHARNEKNHGLKGLQNICKKYTDETYAPILAYEWMGEGGHMNVYASNIDEDNIFTGSVSLRNENTRHITQKSLLDNYRNREDILVLPHISHGFDWMEYDCALQPVVEIYSQWGYSDEYETAIKYSKNSGALQHLEDGKKVGFIAGSDGHHGSPGQTGYTSKYSILGYREGLSGVFALGLSGESIFNGLKRRHCYATTGERILGVINIAEAIMGDELSIDEPKVSIDMIIGGTEKLMKVEVISNGKVVWEIDIADAYTFSQTVSLPMDNEASYYFVRVTQIDGEMAWFSPVFVNR